MGITEQHRELSTLTMQELDKVIEAYPWFSLARKELYNRFSAMGEEYRKEGLRRVAAYIDLSYNKVVHHPQAEPPQNCKSEAEIEEENKREIREMFRSGAMKRLVQRLDDEFGIEEDWDDWDDEDDWGDEESDSNEETDGEANCEIEDKENDGRSDEEDENEEIDSKSDGVNYEESENIVDAEEDRRVVENVVVDVEEEPEKEPVVEANDKDGIIPDIDLAESAPIRNEIYIVGGDYFKKEDFDSLKGDEVSFFERFRPTQHNATDSESTANKKNDNFTDETFYTETLAKIYASQGFYQRALEVYEKLILLYPEKSTYFAALIDETKKYL